MSAIAGFSAILTSAVVGFYYTFNLFQLPCNNLPVEDVGSVVSVVVNVIGVVSGLMHSHTLQ